MRNLALIALAALLHGASPVTAETSGDKTVILTIEGNVPGGKGINFSRGELEKLGLKTIRTTTPWHEGVQVFEGVPMSKIMQSSGAQGRKVQVLALNKYRTEIPFEDFEKYQPLLALKRAGKNMDVKDKGPLFIIYPFDDKPEIRIEQFYSRSAWQVRSMVVE